ncbi:hypothetical protein ND861_18615 [Leptospira sp. 2 VSF19]|uniref:Uncharacterized protein n=1 Tax=Leptospira soteropolitanensis TaxID=2950025 RepID=A0AAW5VRJ7_9LEPT|nr:hypothetical protein [Leptospira soteropolitanensis]MCW7494673.1 hypothetical protein [Leptospira soteropolitanensis]MCW7502269.1 hypothetical protein [Leptospira soteropolitanensis]MCW7524497.1 hypothetical protein [Leptospira soteropolitanensis]MCW7528377.1 hypothetical protein [Leptospira soteropolitanensis]MCW7532223.1 hypothetical protein [Leptospira soteropolitanensis]
MTNNLDELSIQKIKLEIEDLQKKNSENWLSKNINQITILLAILTFSFSIYQYNDTESTIQKENREKYLFERKQRAFKLLEEAKYANRYEFGLLIEEIERITQNSNQERNELIALYKQYSEEFNWYNQSEVYYEYSLFTRSPIYRQMLKTSTNLQIILVKLHQNLKVLKRKHSIENFNKMFGLEVGVQQDENLRYDALQIRILVLSYISHLHLLKSLDENYLYTPHRNQLNLLVPAGLAEKLVNVIFTDLNLKYR